MEQTITSRAKSNSGIRMGAIQDIIEGLRLWELWWRQCTNEVRRRYRRTMLGPMWVTLSMTVFSLALSIVWSNLWKQDVTTYLPFVLSGIIPWMMISSCLGEGCTTFPGATAIMQSRQFPYSILAYTVVGRNLIIFLHNLVAFIIVALALSVSVNWNTLMFIPGLMLLVLNLSWVTLLTAIVCLRYRDVQQLVLIVLQTAMFITPVFWPAEALSGRAKILVDINILYHLCEVVRTPMLGKSVAMQSYLVCIAFCMLGWTLTLWLFAKKRSRLVYWL